MNDFLQLRAVHQLSRSYRALMSAFEAHTGHSMPRWRILLTLYRSGETSQKKLARDLEMDPAALTRQIKAIEREGWVRRQSDAADNRLTNVALTAVGQEVVEAALPLRTAFFAQAFAGMSAAQLHTLETMLAEVEQNIKK